MPDTAHEAVEALNVMATLFETIVQFVDEPDKQLEFAETVLKAQELSYSAEQEINAAVQACTKARVAALSGLGDRRPTLH